MAKQVLVLFYVKISFRYAYELDKSYVFDQLEELQDHPAEREKLDVPEKDWKSHC
ncbi:hypothetical protein [Enterococcus faecium]|uniref:hypothetical protein n=1 Tax=Enterococcus faecium TaxID=1352 RepID=UPI001F51085A|nr:hypothetical protein [Enterococcus faecium]